MTGATPAISRGAGICVSTVARQQLPGSCADLAKLPAQPADVPDPPVVDRGTGAEQLVERGPNLGLIARQHDRVGAPVPDVRVRLVALGRTDPVRPALG